MRERVILINGRCQKKRKAFPPIASRTCFIDFWPLIFCEYDIERTILPYGPISNISIPPKICPNRNFHYASVQFQSPQSFSKAIKRENGRLLGEGKLNVKITKRNCISSYARFHPPPLHHSRIHP